MKRSLLILALLLGPWGQLQASDPDTSTLRDGSSMGLYGVGLYQDLSADVYVGAVYLTPQAKAIGKGQSRKMSMRVLIDTLSARKFTRQWLDGIAVNSSRDERTLHAEQIQKFGEAYQANLIRGDQVSFEYVARDNKTILLLNDVVLAELEGENLYRILENCWIGNSPLSTQFKAGITGQQEAGLAEVYKTRYSALTFSKSRQREIEQALEAARQQAAPPPPAPEPEIVQEAPPAAEPHVTEPPVANPPVANPPVAETAAAPVETPAPVVATPSGPDPATAELIRLEAEKIVREREEAARIVAEKAEAERLAQEQIRIAAEQEELRKEYFGVLSKFVSQHSVYPERAERNNLEGKLKLLIKSDRSGKIVDIVVDTSSGIADLDEAVKKMVIARADPLPQMPEKLPGDSFEFVMPFSFSLDN